MAELLGKKLAKPLKRRRRACRVGEANAREDDQEQVTFNDVIEWLIVPELTLRGGPGSVWVAAAGRHDNG